VPDPLTWKGPGLELTSNTSVMSTHRHQGIAFSIPEFLLFGLLPFAAPNSHSTPKIHHSLLSTLLLKNPRATLPHGRPRPRPNLEGPSSSTCRPIAPPLPATTHYSPPTTHSVFVSPLFSYSYELLFPQPLYFDNDPHCPGGWGYKPPIPL
jgi:hypothetical protein